MDYLQQTLDKIESSYTGLRETAHLVLAVAATTRLERNMPLAVILIGGPSSGKTSMLMPLTKGQPNSVLKESVLRVDDFTPASLVSHASNRSTDDLKKIDLLPRMSGKLVVTKEMAPLFTGHEEELTKKFGVFASVLDGEGYVTSSGTHGERGYTDSIVFSLLGAVTPDVLTQKVYNSLNAVGPRFSFWQMPDRRLDLDTWRGPVENRRAIENDAKQALMKFVDDLFGAYSSGSVPREEFTVSVDVGRLLSRTAVLMSRLRSKINFERGDDGEFHQISISHESPERAYCYLEQVVMGAALIAGHREVQTSGLKLALGLAIGSAVPKRKRVVELFFLGRIERSVFDVSRFLDISEDTARKYIEQLEKLEIIEKINIDGTAQWDLRPEFKELRALRFPHEVSPNHTSFPDLVQQFK